jgi:signal transduction histidine kinase
MDFDRQGSFLEAILKSLSAGVLVLSPGGSVLYRNPAMEVFSGISEGSILPLLERKGLWPPDGSEDAAFDDRSRSWGVVRRPVPGPEGGAIGYVFIFTDVTRIREMEEEMARDRRLRAMGEMIAQIAHELRNPLGSLELFAALLTKDATTPEGREYLGHMTTSIASMDRLIGNLLYHTRTPDLQEGWFDAGTLIGRIADDFSRMVHSASRSRSARTLTFRRVPDSSSVLLCVDEELITHALFNLLGNGLEALLGVPSSENRSRELRLESLVARDRSYLFIVKDNGIGIAEDVAERIFDPFFTTRAKGTGLGLSIVHNLAVAHGGEIRYDREGEWTVFSLSLPPGRVRSKSANGNEGGAR